MCMSVRERSVYTRDSRARARVCILTVPAAPTCTCTYCFILCRVLTASHTAASDHAYRKKRREMVATNPRVDGGPTTFRVPPTFRQIAVRRIEVLPSTTGKRSLIAGSLHMQPGAAASSNCLLILVAWHSRHSDAPTLSMNL